MQLPTTQPTHRDIAWYVDECADLKKQLASLERENAALKNAIAIGQLNCDAEYEQLREERDDAIRQNAALRADKERLDWMQNGRANVVVDFDVRAAIDAAKEGQK